MPHSPNLCDKDKCVIKLNLNLINSVVFKERAKTTCLNKSDKNPF